MILKRNVDMMRQYIIQRLLMPLIQVMKIKINHSLNINIASHNLIDQI